MSKIQLDTSKLLGYRIEAAAAAKVGSKPIPKTGAKVGSKVGSKVGLKPA